MTTCQPLVIQFGLLACLAPWGCASTGPVTPVEVVEAFARADASTRAVWLADPESSAAHPGELHAPAVEVQRTARWPRPGRRDVSVSRVDARWSVTSGVMESGSAETPAQAMVLFARAVTTMDASLLRTLMPTEERAFWSLSSAGELLRHPGHRPALLALLQAISDQPVPATAPDSGETVAIGDERGQVVLVREQDGWKVLDLRPHERFLPAQESPPPPKE